MAHVEIWEQSVQYETEGREGKGRISFSEGDKGSGEERRTDEKEEAYGAS